MAFLLTYIGLLLFIDRQVGKLVAHNFGKLRRSNFHLKTDLTAADYNSRQCFR